MTEYIPAERQLVKDNGIAHIQRAFKQLAATIDLHPVLLKNVVWPAPLSTVASKGFAPNVVHLAQPWPMGTRRFRSIKDRARVTYAAGIVVHYLVPHGETPACGADTDGLPPGVVADSSPLHVNCSACMRLDIYKAHRMERALLQLDEPPQT